MGTSGFSITPRAKAGAWFCASAVAVMASIGTTLASPAGAVTDTSVPGASCPDVEVLFARGTFEAPGVGATGQAFVDALESRLPGKSVQVYPVNYPASLDFQQAADGVADASTKINAVVASCPASKIVIGGYSQGAAVAAYTTSDSVPDGYILPANISGTMAPSTAAHVGAVALFGTPSAGIMNLVGGGAPPLTIGHLYTGKTIEMCVPGDPVCDPNGGDRSAHSAYENNGMADQAADFVVNAMANHT